MFSVNSFVTCFYKVLGIFSWVLHVYWCDFPFFRWTSYCIFVWYNSIRTADECGKHETQSPVLALVFLFWFNLINTNKGHDGTNTVASTAVKVFFWIVYTRYVLCRYVCNIILHRYVISVQFVISVHLCNYTLCKKLPNWFCIWYVFSNN